MPDKCLETHELEEVLALPEDHPRRRHLRDCARCRALMASYAEFLEPGEQPGARPEDARRDLAAALDDRILGSKEKAGFMDRLFSRAWRPALAAAALVLIFIGSRALFFGGPDEIRYRGEAFTDDFVFPAEVLEDGAVQFRWHSVERADEYRLLILGSDLLEMEALSAGADTVFVLPASMLRDLEAAGPLYWEVYVYRNTDRLTSSKVRSLP